NRWQAVELHGVALKQLVRLRSTARDSFSEEHRRALLSFDRMGLQQAERERRTVSLMVRYHVSSRRHSIDEVPQMARDLFRVGAALARLVLVALVLAAALWARRRWRGWLERLRTTTFRSLTSVAGKRRAQRVFRWCETIGPWVLFLITIAVLRWALGPAAAITEINAVLTVLTIFGAYRLAIDVVATMFVNIAVHYGLDATDTRRAMLLRSVRLVLRVATILVVIRLVSGEMGQGFLGTLVTKFAWVIVLAAVLVELFRWRGVMIETFLKLQPTGRLADTLRDTRSRWYGAFLAPAAFAWLAGRGAATVVREFALGFEQTQKALAFLFRQRVQRQAEKQGYAEGDVGELPEELVETFGEEAIEAGPLVVANFPGMEELHGILTTWRDTGSRGSYLLTGERGIGKTTWLNQIRRKDLEIQRIVLGHRVTDAADLCGRLSELLEVDAGPDPGPRELGRALYCGPKRVVVLDMAQHLFLANVGGYDAFSAFATLVNRTCNNVFWLCSMSAYAWRHLRAVRPDATVFRTRRHLVGWSDEQITALIRARCATSGVRFNYGDLVVDRLEGVSVRSRLIESEEGYSRLLWDYSDGNPRAALHFFLRSLDPDRGKSVRVRLFKAPDIELLEDGGQDGLFVLAAIVTHESICLDDLVEVTRFDRVQSFIHIDRLLELGAITLDNEMYRVSTTWHRAAVRLLRRRNLLPE
ncbi:MAG: ATP-binding protein, partial [Thermoanaerobaculales bacterium]|nr:ATP-binding protein [Thermoanaerobaculales bacterium]